MTAWEYWVEEVSLADRWSAKRQAAEIAAFRERLNQVGREGWELISFSVVPLYGAMSSTLKGTLYLAIYKRPVGAPAPQPQVPPAPHLR